MEKELDFFEKEKFFTSFGDQNLKTVIEKLPFALFVVGPEEKVLYLNAAAERIYQCKFSTVLHQQLSKVLFLNNPKIISEALADIFHGRKKIMVEWDEEQYYEGRIFWRQGHLFPVLNQQGTVEYGIVLILDVTEQMRTEKRLKKSLEEFQLLFEKSPDPILVLRGDQIIGANAAWGKMMGGAKEDFLGKSIGDISPETQGKGVFSKKLAEEKIYDTLAGKPQLFKWKYLTKQGEIIKTEVNFTSLSSPEIPSLIQAIVRKNI